MFGGVAGFTDVPGLKRPTGHSRPGGLFTGKSKSHSQSFNCSAM